MKQTKPPRGRPKTLDRDQVINIAMMSYWTEGPMNVSLNEICKRAGVSKPGVYREFGSEDGLKHTVLSAYSRLLIEQFQPLLNRDKSFEETLEALIAIALQDKSEQELPSGCLHVASCNCIEQLGIQTAEITTEIREHILANYETIIERAKKRGEFKSKLSTRLAALYINEQIGNAMLQQKRGESADDIKAILTLALSVLV